MPCAMWTAIGAMHVHDERASGRFRGWPARRAARGRMGWVGTRAIRRFLVSSGHSTALQLCHRGPNVSCPFRACRVSYRQALQERAAGRRNSAACGSAPTMLGFRQVSCYLQLQLHPGARRGVSERGTGTARDAAPYLCSAVLLLASWAVQPLPSCLLPGCLAAEARCTVAPPRLAARNAASGFHVHCRPARPVRPVCPCARASTCRGNEGRRQESNRTVQAQGGLDQIGFTVCAELANASKPALPLLVLWSQSAERRGGREERRARCARRARRRHDWPGS